MFVEDRRYLQMIDVRSGEIHIDPLGKDLNDFDMLIKCVIDIHSIG